MDPCMCSGTRDSSAQRRGALARSLILSGCEPDSRNYICDTNPVSQIERFIPERSRLSIYNPLFAANPTFLSESQFETQKAATLGLVFPPALTPSPLQLHFYPFFVLFKKGFIQELKVKCRDARRPFLPPFPSINRC